jgi:hemerythrin
LIRHFIHEEKIIDRLGLEFPEEHKTEHVRLTGLLEKRIADWKSGRLDGKDIAEEVRALLLIHVVEYDIKLTKTDNKSPLR